MNHQTSAIDNFTPLHFTSRFWSCMEAAENRSDMVGGGGGGGAFHCLYYPHQSHRTGGLESLLSMEYA